MDNVVSGKWQEIKGEIQKTWGKLTGDDLERSKGNMKSIAGIIEQKYGHKKEEIGAQLESIYSRFGEKVDEMKKDAADKTEEYKQDLKKSDQH